jgi:Tol biopolymer transport system component
VYLSDNNGHGNLWIAGMDGGGARRITFERDPAVTIGVPCWSPDGRRISYIVSRGATELWLVSADGRAPRRLVDRGFGGEWSPDGEWLYYSPSVLPIRWSISKFTCAREKFAKSDRTAARRFLAATRCSCIPGADLRRRVGLGVSPGVTRGWSGASAVPHRIGPASCLAGIRARCPVAGRATAGDPVAGQ